MLVAIILILTVLWFFGYFQFPGIVLPNFVLFVINNHPVTLWEILILAVISWAIGILPSPFQTIAGVLLVLWVLSVLGFLAFAGLSNLIILVIIIGLIVSIFV